LGIDKIAKYLLSLKQKTILIAVDGRSGTGKSTFAKYFANELKQYKIKTDIIQTDNFYQKQKVARSNIDGYAYGYFWEKLREQVILPLKNNKAAEFKLSDWTTGKVFGQRKVEANQMIIIEGVISTYKEIADLFDLKIWLGCQKEARIKRIVNRGDFPEEELKNWQIIEDDYVSGQNKLDNANIIIDTSTDYENGKKYIYKFRKLKLPDVSSLAD